MDAAKLTEEIKLTPEEKKYKLVRLLYTMLRMLYNGTRVVIPPDIMTIKLKIVNAKIFNKLLFYMLS